jgi:hypothetical protein
MPLDPKEFEKVFANHFEKISPEQFLDNLKAACPCLFDEDSIVNANEAETQEDRVNIDSIKQRDNSAFFLNKYKDGY